jgi:hypothetical protein
VQFLKAGLLFGSILGFILHKQIFEIFAKRSVSEHGLLSVFEVAKGSFDVDV